MLDICSCYRERTVHHHSIKCIHLNKKSLSLKMLSFLQEKSKHSYDWELDTSNLQKDSTFSIPPKELIERCKIVIESKIGLENEDDLDEMFQFIFPVIGPLSKEEYLQQVRGFALEEMFPEGIEPLTI